MVASAAMQDALAELFDKRRHATIVVSGYDDTVLYANDAVARDISRKPVDGVTALPMELVGRNVRDILSGAQLDYTSTVMAAAIASNELQIRRLDELPGNLWACGSVLPLQDVSVTILGTFHDADLTRDQAAHQHIVMSTQAAVALEFSEAERLIQVGMEALHRSRQRIHRLKDTLLDPELRQHFP